MRESNFTFGYILHGLASQALGRTQQRRPDLFAQKCAAGLTKDEQRLLDEYLAGQNEKRSEP